MLHKQSNIILASFSGILGTVALTLYFTAPFSWMPLPPENATSIQILEFGKKYHTQILIDTWLQQFGTILSVIFALALVHIAGASKTFAGRLTLLAATVVTSLSLAEGTFALCALHAGDNGHLESALTCFDLTNTFVHIFLLAPSLFLMLGFSLMGTSILPRIFILIAIVLGGLFQFLGVLSLFFDQFLPLVIGILILQNLWTISASFFLLFRIKTIQTETN